ncbi:NapC/NirT family cytochrome c [Endozoicomonadaceae bacterium StTr2]
MRVLKQLLQFASKPTARYSAGGLIIFGIVFGLASWGTFNWTMNATSTEEFCISCHELEQNAYAELQDTIHYSNSTGTRATCGDCHIPHDFVGKVLRKIEAAREVYGHFTGIIDTPEKYEEHRLAMAERVWDKMQANDSAACRHCHVNLETSLDNQYEWARVNHQKMIDENLTCIDCHQGIAHKLPNTKLMKKPIPAE